MTDDSKEKVTKLFDTVATHYDNPSMRYFPFCGDRLITHLHPRPGSKVLDIATGTGAVALPAAQAIAPGGRVQAIDLSQNMLDVAEANLKRAGLDNVDYHVMDATKLDFKSQYFDFVTCSFGIFFLDDMIAALREWRRVLKPGGRIMFTSFAASAFQPLAKIFRTDLQQFGVEVSSDDWMRLSHPSECLNLMAQAELQQAELAEEQMGYHLNDAASWWELVHSSGFRGYLSQIAPQRQAEFQQQHLANIQQHENDKGLWLDVAVMFVSAIRGSD